MAGVLFGQYRFVFDRQPGAFEREGRTVCSLDQITGVEVQATAVEPGHDAFMLVVAHPGGAEHLYFDENKAAVAELAARIAAFVGAEVTHREQPFQRQVREAGADVVPASDLHAASPARLPNTVRAAVFTYQDAAGGHHLGQSFPLTPEEADPWRRFDVAAILVNRDRPEQSMLAELRPIRRSTRGERNPDGDPKAPSRRPGLGPEPDERRA